MQSRRQNQHQPQQPANLVLPTYNYNRDGSANPLSPTRTSATSPSRYNGTKLGPIHRRGQGSVGGRMTNQRNGAKVSGNTLPSPVPNPARTTQQSMKTSTEKPLNASPQQL